MVIDGKDVWVSSGSHVIKYIRGKEVCYALPCIDSCMIPSRPSGQKACKPIGYTDRLHAGLWFPAAFPNARWYQNVHMGSRRWRYMFRMHRISILLSLCQNFKRPFSSTLILLRQLCCILLHTSTKSLLAAVKEICNCGTSVLSM